MEDRFLALLDLELFVFHFIHPSFAPFFSEILNSRIPINIGQTFVSKAMLCGSVFFLNLKLVRQ